MHNIRRILATLFCVISATLAAFAQRNYRVAVIRAELGGQPFSVSEEYIDSTLREASSYYNEQCAPGLNVTFELGPVVSLTGSYTNETAHLAVDEACRLANTSVNYRRYDSDSDGTVDCMGVLFSGEEVWPQYHTLSAKNIYLRLDHVLIDGYFALSEIIYNRPFGIGPICHEFGHSLGLQDLYDTDLDGSGGLAECLWGSLALMDKGDHNDSLRTPAGLCAIDFDMLGLGTCDTLAAGEYTLRPFSESHTYLRHSTDTPGEYFLFECRTQSGWDRYIGGSGLLIYHIDRSLNRAGYSTYYNITLRAAERWEKNEVNARPDHQCADLVEAYPEADTVSAVFFPYGGLQTFSSDSEPAFRSWDNSPARFALKDIAMNADSSITFTVIEPISESTNSVFQNSAILRLKIDPALLDEIDSCTVAVRTARENPMICNVLPDAEGHLTVMLDSLKAGTAYTTLTTVYTPDAIYSKAGSFKTMVIDGRNTTPFIYFTGGVRAKDGTFQKGARFPLYVYNSNGAESISWYFGDRPAATDSEGYFTLTSDGTLRAEINWPDGTTDVIVKEIVTR